jgi:hypothetical protein
MWIIPARRDDGRWTKKKASIEAFSFKRAKLLRLDVRRLLAFWTSGNFESYFLVFSQRFETRRIDSREMREQVFAAIIRGDETETFCVVEPLNST